MIAAAALLFAASVPCDAGGVLRAIETSSLPPRTACNVAAKVRWAETMCRADSIAPVKAQDELRIAREWASADRGVTRAIDGAIYAFDHPSDVPARLTIHGGRGDYTIDGVRVNSSDETLTVPLRAGKHEVFVHTPDYRESTVTVTLAEGEPRSIEMNPVTPPRNPFWVLPQKELLTREALAHFCVGVYHSTGFGANVAALHEVTIEKRGRYDVTDLFAVAGSTLCTTDGAALDEILGGGGPFTIRVRARTSGGKEADASWTMRYGRELVVRGSVPDSIRFVWHDGREELVRGGRFEVKVREGLVQLVAASEDRRQTYFHDVELHCDGEVRLTPETLEVVSGGCPGGPRSEWRPLESVRSFEAVQHLAFVLADGKLVPQSRWVSKGLPLQAYNEEALPTSGEGVFLVRAYSENGTLVYRSVVRRLEIYSHQGVVVSNDIAVDVPTTAASVEIKGWTPQTSGRFEIGKDFR